MKSPNSINEPGITRRTAIGNGIAIAAGTVFATGLPALADKPLLAIPGGSIAYVLPEEHWANLIDEIFLVRGFSYDDQVGNPRARLTLVEATEVVPGEYDQDRPETLRRFAISLLFRSSGKAALAEASYRLKHPWFGEFDLLLTQIKSRRFPNENIYEAIINN